MHCDSTIGARGIIARSSDVASTPSIRGIARSITTRSGFNALAFSIVSTPSTASPQTSRPNWLSRKSRVTFRRVSLSSTSRMCLDIRKSASISQTRLRHKRFCGVNPTSGSRAYSCRTTVRRDLLILISPLYSMKPIFLNLFINIFTRERVVPIISASIS
jgi:hypothetical protein